jgi:hypothetical protein
MSALLHPLSSPFFADSAKNQEVSVERRGIL